MPNERLVPGQTFSERITVAAARFLGRPYQLKGDDSKFDCSQLVLLVLRSMGFMLQDMTAADFRKSFFTLSSPPASGPIVGAIFRSERGKVVHIGLLGTGGDTVIHTTYDDGCTVIRALDHVTYDEISYLDCSALMSYLQATTAVPPRPQK